MSEFAQKMDLRQSQNLVMTPQLQQAIKLLQLNNMELTEFVETALADNPLLEKAPPEEGEDQPAPAEQSQTDEIQGEFDSAWTGDETGAPSPAASDFDPGMASTGAGGRHDFTDIENSFENTMSENKTLREHLLEQLHLSFSDNRDRLVGALLIDRLNENGYLPEKPDDLASSLECAPERVEKLLGAMKQFDPPGIFARDLAECLSLQLADQGRLDAPMKALLDNLDKLAAHDYEGLAKTCEVNDTYLQDMVAEIRTLNPKPAAAFEHFTVQTAIPDALMHRLPKHEGGGWRVVLNNDTLPRVLVNNDYYTEVAGRARTKEDKAYLEGQMQSASWLVKALDQRAKTVLKTAAAIVEAQEAFFLYGIEYMKPLTLREIADEIAMHESTVSRVTTNKYIGTPRGLFELKYFFSASLGEGAGAHAAEAVKARIKSLIDAEKPGAILSDDKIVDILKGENITLARRTVAKYREALRIPSSVQRRKEKRA